MMIHSFLSARNDDGDLRHLLQMAKYGNGEAGGNSQFVCTISHALTLGRYWH